MQIKMKVPRTILQELAIASLATIAIVSIVWGYSEGIVAGAIASISGLGGYAIRHNSNKH